MDSNNTVLEQNNFGYTAPECRDTLAYVFDAILGIKGILLILLNIQGFLWWWRKTRGYRFLAIKALMILCACLVSQQILLLDNIAVCIQIFEKRDFVFVPVAANQLVFRILHSLNFT
jgi:hypothetical protein